MQPLTCPPDAAVALVVSVTSVPGTVEARVRLALFYRQVRLTRRAARKGRIGVIIPYRFLCPSPQVVAASVWCACACVVAVAVGAALYAAGDSVTATFRPTLAPVAALATVAAVATLAFAVFVALPRWEENGTQRDAVLWLVVAAYFSFHEAATVALLIWTGSSSWLDLDCAELGGGSCLGDAQQRL